ncbi:DUF2239 family protein, partial [Acinetobacter baumannii]
MAGAAGAVRGAGLHAAAGGTDDRGRGRVSAGGYTAFDGAGRLAAGTLAEAAIAVRRAADAGAAGPLLVFDDATGRVVDVDTR